MKIINFSDTETVGSEASINDLSRLQWIDFSRSEKLLIGQLEEVLHVKHHSDLMNSNHPPYYELTDEYEVLICRTIDKRYGIDNPQTRSIAFLICENTVITVHDENDETLSDLFDKWSNARNNRINDLLTLLHLLLDEIVNGFLRLMEPLYMMASEWQKQLLDPNDPFDDWTTIMHSRSSMRNLNTIIEMQKDVFLSWQEQTGYEFNASHTIKFNDLNEHLGRVIRLSDGLSADLDSLTQIYFASSSQQTNSNVQFLAVISAIFLPLNLIAGIFGMNFKNIPLLDVSMGVYIILAVMLLISVALLWWFKTKNWY